MEPASKQRRTGILIVIAVLVVVCGWWASFVPLSKQYRMYKREIKLRETLLGIKPPVGTKVKSITSWHLEDIEAASGSYSIDSNFDIVEAHYKQEFPRHGFVYQKEDSTQEVRTSVFCAPDYEAVLSPLKSKGHPLNYIILIHRNREENKC